jgi:threonine dehydratase
MMAERNHVVAEGAGATSVAAALTGQAGAGKVVCVVSGGNIDPSKLATVLSGNTP